MENKKSDKKNKYDTRNCQELSLLAVEYINKSKKKKKNLKRNKYKQIKEITL